MRTVPLLLLLAITLVTPACGPHHALGGGLGAMRVETGGDSDVGFSPVLGARLGIPALGGGLFWAADLQPLPARNPSRDESVSSLFLLPSFQLPAGPVRIRAGAGPSFHIWTGDDPAESSSIGLAAGGSVEVPLGPESRWALETLARLAWGEEVTGTLFAIQLNRYLR